MPSLLSSFYSQTCLQSLCRTDCEQRTMVFSAGSSPLVRPDPEAPLLCYVYRLLSHRVNTHVNVHARTHTSNCLQTHFTTECVCERERQRGREQTSWRRARRRSERVPSELPSQNTTIARGSHAGSALLSFLTTTLPGQAPRQAAPFDWG